MRNPNNYGSVVKLGGKRRNPYAIVLTVGYDEDGKRKRKYVSYHKGKREANQALASLNESGIPTEQTNQTFKEIFDLWKSTKNVKPKTEQWYDSVCTKYEPIHNKPIRSIRLADIQKVVDRYNESHEIQKRMKSVCMQVFDYAIARDITSKNYASFLNIVKNEKSTMHKIFTDEEIQQLWDNIDTPLVDVVLILIYTGMRVGEILSLKNEDIFRTESGRLYAQHGSKTEAGRNRCIPFSKRITKLVEDKMSEREYFVSTNDIHNFHYDVFRRRFDKVMNSLSMSHTSYDTRHTFTTLMSKTDVNKLVLKRILGHADNNITDKIYTHVEIQQLFDAVDKLK